MSAMLDAEDVSRQLNVSLATAYREMRRMLHVVVGKRGLRVSEAALEAYVSRNSSQPRGATRGKASLPKPLSEPIRPIHPRRKHAPRPNNLVQFPVEPSSGSETMDDIARRTTNASAT